MSTQQITDEAAVRELLASADRAWDAGDATAFAAVFAEDADYVTWFGQRVQGRAAIEAQHAPCSPSI